MVFEIQREERNCEMVIKAVFVHASLIALLFWLASRRDSPNRP